MASIGRLAQGLRVEIYDDSRGNITGYITLCPPPCHVSLGYITRLHSIYAAVLAYFERGLAKYILDIYWIYQSLPTTVPCITWCISHGRGVYLLLCWHISRRASQNTMRGGFILHSTPSFRQVRRGDWFDMQSMTNAFSQTKPMAGDPGYLITGE